MMDTQPPYPEMLDDRKYGVRGPTPVGRMLQVIFILVKLEDVQSEEYQRLPLHQRIALEDGEPGARIIHSRDLTISEKRQLRRRRRGQ
jgi:hypothetical protein